MDGGDTVTATSPLDQCARPRKRDGQRCTLPPVMGDSCHMHLTAVERAVYVAERADDPRQAAEYLAAWAMYVRRADRKRDNPLRKMGL